MPKPSADLGGCLARRAAQRDLLEEEREHEGDERNGDSGEEDDVQGVRVRVDDRGDLVGRVGVQRLGRGRQPRG